MLFFDATLLYIKEAIALIGVLVIIIGSLRAAYELLQFLSHKQYDASNIRMQLGTSIILGLEFMVGADIVGSLVEPDYYNLGLLAILVIIRTILSYFLNIELEGLSPRQRQAVK